MGTDNKDVSPRVEFTGQYRRIVLLISNVQRDIKMKEIKK